MIHLVTAADGASEFYDFKNEARFESPEEAIERDHKLKTAYVGHNRVTVIGNDGDFQTKMDKTLAFVNSLLGLPTERTRYKKFLLRSFGPKSTTVDQDFPEFQHRIFNQTDEQPFNHEAFRAQTGFTYDTNLIQHTYILAP